MRRLNDTLQEILYRTRATGNTTWILQAAIKNPNCMIVSKDKKQSRWLEQKYHNLLSEKGYFKRLYWRVFGRKHPKFVDVNNDFRGWGMPVIFDNGAFA